MSLTNPNTPISQQDLQDFYHKLLPYISGGESYTAGDGIEISNDVISTDNLQSGDMDDIVTPIPSIPTRVPHKYSTTEQIVGEWIDGRPIYEKTVSGTMPAAGSDTKISVSSDTIDFALMCHGTVPTYRTQPLSDYLGASIDKIFLIMTFFDTEEQKVYLRNTGVPAAQGKTAYVTVTYVKTTT